MEQHATIFYVQASWYFQLFFGIDTLSRLSAIALRTEHDLLIKMISINMSAFRKHHISTANQLVLSKRGYTPLQIPSAPQQQTAAKFKDALSNNLESSSRRISLYLLFVGWNYPIGFRRNRVHLEYGTNHRLNHHRNLT